MEILDDKTAVEGIKEKSRPAHIKAWVKFRLFSVENWWSLKLGYQPNRSLSCTEVSQYRKKYGVIKHVYYMHDKFNHQGKIWIIFEGFPQNN